MLQTSRRRTGVHRVTVVGGVGRTPFGYRVAYLLASIVLRLLFRFEITGREKLPAGPFIAVANHLNWLDTFAVLLALPAAPQVYLAGWDSVLNATRLRWLIRKTRFGFIAIPRDPAARIRRRVAIYNALCDCLQSGNPLALFPEGPVGHVEGAVGDFKSGFARVAIATGVPVVPVALSGTRELWWRKTVKIAIGMPVSPRGRKPIELVRVTRGAVLQLMPVYCEPRGPKLLRSKLTALIPTLTDWRELEPKG